MGDWFGTNLEFEDFENLLKADDLAQEPMPMQRFVTDRHYLGLEFALSDIQLEIARHITQIFKPETLMTLEGTEFLGGMTPEEYYKRYTVNEVICQVGKGAGKDHTSRISMAYIGYLMHCLRDPLKYYGKASGVYVDLVNLAVNAKQAQQVFFDPLKNILLRSPWANEVGFEPRVQEIFWFDRPVRMFSGHSEAEGWEGYEVMVVVLDEISAFKALPNNALVLTPNGMIKNGDLRPGDYVIGSDGKRTRIAGVYPQGRKEVFEVTFEDGAKVQCSDNHIWNIYEYSDGRRLENKNMQLKDFRSLRLQSGNEQYRYSVPAVRPVEFEPDADLPINPYLMGILLSEGSLRSPLGFTSNDAFIVDKISGIIEGVVPSYENCKPFEWRINSGGRLESHLKDLGLWSTTSHTKFIPDAYLRASIEDRIELLRGLMDGDGTAARGQGSYTTVSDRLKDDFIELCRSLGGLPVSSCHPSWYLNGNGERVACSDRHMISPRVPMNPFSLPRKADAWIPHRRQMRRSIVDVQSLGYEDEMTCIKVANENGLYVIDNYVVTHNTDVELKGDLRNKGSASVIYEMARASITSRFPDVGKVVLLSFPRFKNDFIQQRYKSVIDDLKEQGAEITEEKWGNKGIERERKTWALKAATWDVNPTRKREEFDDEFRRDPIMARARYESLVAGTRIWTSRGLLPIEEIVEGDYVQTRFGPKEIVKSWKQTEAKSCVEIEFKNGSKIQCSENHPFLKINSVYPAVHRAKYGDYATRWEVANQLKIGDKIHCHYDNDVYGANSFVDDAYILGLGLSDGNIRCDGRGGRNYLSIACGKDRSFAEEISSRIDGYVITQKDAGTYAARVDKRSVVGHFTGLGLERKPSSQKDVPASIFLADEKTIWSFISGVIDGDGCVRPDDGRISIVSTSKKMLENIQLIMHGMGCRSSITINREPDSGAAIQSNYTLFSLNFTKYSSKLIADNINLFSYKKENLVRAHITAAGKDKNTGFTYVKNIQPIGLHEVYDIWVDDVEEFVCNGIVVHNCEPPEMEDAYFRDVEAVRSAFMLKPNPVDEAGHYADWFRGNDQHNRYIHIDLGLKRDRAALGMVHCPGLKEIKTRNGVEKLPIIEMDFLQSWEALPYQEIPFAEVRNVIVDLTRRFNVASVTFDQWQSADMIQSLRSLGINADLHTVKKTDYDTLSTAIYDKRFRGYWNELLVEEELLKLKLINNTKIDHPSTGSKDLADAIAGSTFMCLKELTTDIEIEIEVLQSVDYDELTNESIDMVQRYKGSARYATDVNKEMPQDIAEWLRGLEMI